MEEELLDASGDVLYSAFQFIHEIARFLKVFLTKN